ncbi:MAG: VOC family protein [Trueperaceae bacterium]
MLGETPLIAFVCATDADRVKNFYVEVLGLQLIAEEPPFALVLDSNGVMVRVSLLREFQPAPFTVLGWEVDDIAAKVQVLAAKGVRFTRYPHFEQDAHGVWTSPDGTKVAWFKDRDENTLSLTEFPSA